MTAPRTAQELNRRARQLPAGDGAPREHLVERLGLVYDTAWREVAVYEQDGSDGIEARVDVSRWPAMFYRIRVGDMAFTTGSSAEDLAHVIAKGFAEGMLGIEGRVAARAAREKE